MLTDSDKRLLSKKRELTIKHDKRIRGKKEDNV